VASGKPAAMSYEVEDTPDMIKIFVGAIPAYKPVFVKSIFNQILDVEDLS